MTLFDRAPQPSGFGEKLQKLAPGAGDYGFGFESCEFVGELCAVAQEFDRAALDRGEVRLRQASPPREGGHICVDAQDDGARDRAEKFVWRFRDHPKFLAAMARVMVGRARGGCKP